MHFFNKKTKKNKQVIAWFHGNESLIIVNRMCHLKRQEVYQNTQEVYLHMQEAPIN